MLKISILNHFPILLSLHHKLVRKIIRLRLVVLGITALFTELGQLHIHMIGKRDVGSNPDTAKLHILSAQI